MNSKLGMKFKTSETQLIISRILWVNGDLNLSVFGLSGTHLYSANFLQIVYTFSFFAAFFFLRWKKFLKFILTKQTFKTSSSKPSAHNKIFENVFFHLSNTEILLNQACTIRSCIKWPIKRFGIVRVRQHRVRLCTFEKATYPGE